MAAVKSNFSVVGIGEVLWDLLPAGKKLGGAPANFAYHAQNLGAAGSVVSAVGDDALGEELLLHLSSIGLTHDYISVEKKYPTGTVDVKLGSDGSPQYVIHTNVAWDFLPFNEKLRRLASGASAVCFGTLAQRSEAARKAIQAFLRATPTNCLRIFDINLRQRFYDAGIIRNTLRFANCLKLNQDELPEVADMLALSGSEDKILRTLIEQFDLLIIALTKGENGSRLFSKKYDSFLKTPEVEVVDSVGAGDAFTAALAMGLLQRLPVEVIHRNATRLAAFVCTQNGAMPVFTEELRMELLNI